MADAITMTNQERAKKAASERWHSETPKATHTGILQIAGHEIHCDVLKDGRRVLRQKTLLSAMGRGKIGGKQRRGLVATNLPVFVQADNLTPYLEAPFLERAQLIRYKGIDGQKLIGYEASILPAACKIYVRAEDDGILHENQKKVATVCRSMIYGLATVGIIALVDECTGYEFAKQRNELQILLEKFILKDLMPWTKKFPDEFFEQVYRIHGWNWPKINKNHPSCVGPFINKYIYEMISPEVLEELKKQNPVNDKGNRNFRFHQKMTDLGNSTLDKQLIRVTTAMKISDNLDQFKQFMERC